MEYILLSVTLILTLYCFLNKRYRKSLVSSFLFLWLIIFIFYFFRIGGLYDCLDSTFFLYLIGIVSFFIGYIFLPIRVKNKTINKSKIDILKIRILLILSFIGIVVFSLKCAKALPFWLSGNGGNLKAEIILEDALYVNPLVEILFVYVARPLQKVMTIFAICITFQKYKPYYYNSIISNAITLTLLCYICTGSKFALSEILVCSIGYLYLFSNLKIKIVLKRYSRLISLICLSVIIIILVMSMGDEDPMFKLYCYICGCMPCSNEAFMTLQNSPNMLGSVSFNGILRFFTIIPSSLGFFTNIKDLLDLSYSYMMRFETTTYIAYMVPYNAFVSMFIYFFADGGYAGVCVLSLLFGLFCAYSLERAKKRPSFESISMVLLLFLFIMTSMVRIQTFMVYYAECIFFIMFFIPRYTIRLNDNR